MHAPIPTRVPTPEVRPAEPRDAAAIAEVHLAAWRAAYGHVFPGDALSDVSAADREDVWRRTIGGAAPRRRVLVAGDRGGPPRGFAVWSPTRDADGDPATTAELCALYVHPAAWGSGLGRVLLARGTALARADGFARATLWVVADNDRARRVYAAAGWTPDGARRWEEVLGARVPEVRYARPLGGGRGADGVGPGAAR